MADLLGAMRVEIVGDNSKLDKSIDNSKKKTEDYGKSTAKLGSSLGKLFTGIGFAVVAKKLFDLGKQAENLFKVQELAETKLDATLKATGEAAGLTADELKNMASALQEVTTFGDEAIIGAESLLLTFKDIGGNVFPRALESILDVSSAMGQDLKTSTIQIGKALNDPVAGLAALTRVGIQFTDVQKDLIKGFQENGDLASAQGVILKELESQFGGVAKAAALTSDGISKQLDNSYGDLLETIGEVISKGLTPYRLGLIEEVQTINKNIQAHILRKKALEGNATLVENLTLRQLEQEKAEKALAQAILNINNAEEQVLDTRHLSAVQIEQIEKAKAASIIRGQQTVEGLRDEVKLRTMTTETARKELEAENDLIAANIALSTSTDEATDSTAGNTDANNENTESITDGLIVTTDATDKLNALLVDQAREHGLLKDSIIEDNEEIAESEEDIQARREAAIQHVAGVIQDILDQRVANARAASEEFLGINGVEIDSLTAKAKTEEGLNNAEQARLNALNAEKKRLANEQYDRELEAFKVGKAFKIADTIQAGANAAINAFNSLAGIPLVGPVLGGIAAAAVGILTGVQVGLIASQAAPPKPAFAQGGIVAGNSFVGDKIPVMADSGEMFINRKDQNDLMSFIKGGSNGNGGGNTTVKAIIDKKVLFSIMLTGSKQGQLQFDKRSLIN